MPGFFNLKYLMISVVGSASCSAELAELFGLNFMMMIRLRHLNLTLSK